jgi:energy-coupling factor transport system substrate-specific component
MSAELAQPRQDRASRSQAGDPPAYRWRTVDIIVASVIAAVFGLIYWGWDTASTGMSAAFTWFPPSAGIIAGVWWMAGVLGGLVIRKPGAAIYTETLAALFSALVAVQWSGTSIVVYGLIQGLGAEIAFLLVRYRSFRLPVALLAGALAGLAEAVLDLWIYSYYPEFSSAWQLAYIGVLVLSGLVIAGAVSWLLVRALATTGVLAPFGSGREQRLV